MPELRWCEIGPSVVGATNEGLNLVFNEEKEFGNQITAYLP